MGEGQLFYLPVEPTRVNEAGRPSDKEFLMGSFNDPFPLGDQFFVQFFAGTEAGELKLDIHVRLESRAPDKVPRHVDDLNRGPQVGDEEPAHPQHSEGAFGFSDPHGCD
jgi:hypothetical protein